MGLFVGKFNGNNHVIRNVFIDQPNTFYVGLFRSVGSGGQINNLGLENISITGQRDVGGLVGNTREATIKSCYTTGSIKGDISVGGLVGSNEDGVIATCCSTGTVNGTSIYGISNSVGGLVGGTYKGTITSCSATGAVSGVNSIGGLVGGNSGTIISCYATGLINGVNYVGGLVGASNSYTSIVTSCYATGSVNGTYEVGGLVGSQSSGTTTSSFWDTETSKQATSKGGTGLTTAEMKTLSTFTGANWDFASTWAICEGTNYPRLKWQISSMDWLCPDNLGEEDLNLIRTSWLSQTGSATWDSRCDLNQDGKINSMDLLLFRKAWAQQQP